MRSSVPWSTCAGRFSLLDIQVDCNWIIVDRFHLFVKWSSVLTTEVDAFLYLGPQDLRLKEKLPADIALDEDYRSESQKGGSMFGISRMQPLKRRRNLTGKLYIVPPILSFRCQNPYPLPTYPRLFKRASI